MTDRKRVRSHVRDLDGYERLGAGRHTLEFSTNFVRAITQTTVRVYDDAGRLYAHAKSTCLVQRSAR